MKAFYIFLISLFSVGIFSQDQNNKPSHQDIVILKDKSEFVGQIIEYEVGRFVTIQTTIEKPLTFKMEDVDRVIQDLEVVTKIEEPFEMDRVYYHLDVGAVIKSEGDMGYVAGATVVKQWSPYMGFGGGANYMDYGDQYVQHKRIAVFGTYRIMQEKDNSVFVQLDLGYAANPEDRQVDRTYYNNGLFARPKIGVRFGTSALMYTLHVAANLHWTKTDLIINEWGSWQEERTLKRTELSIGLLF